MKYFVVRWLSPLQYPNADFCWLRGLVLAVEWKWLSVAFEYFGSLDYEQFFVVSGMRAHDIRMTSYQRRCDVMNGILVVLFTK